jgi:hypothetical protein
MAGYIVQLYSIYEKYVSILVIPKYKIGKGVVLPYVVNTPTALLAVLRLLATSLKTKFE